MKPLAVRLRPGSLNEFIGQNHIVGENSILRNSIKNKNLHSMIFWGPPGVGKTTLAKLIAKEVDYEMFELNAISSGVKEVRLVIEKAQNNLKLLRKKSILFIDEIHRFSKSQQDSLLKAVEDGTVILIGATTENPSFEVISALLSRCEIYTLKELSKDDLNIILKNAINKELSDVKLKETDLLIKYSGGDARKLLSYLEILVNETNEISNDLTKKVLSKKSLSYDKNGEYHYDIISAFIKSIRGSDPNAALYYLAKMLVGGEDVKFIARRLLIIASEDIGLANSNAQILAQSVFNTVSVLGMPEARIPLSHLTVYLSTCKKSNSVYLAIDKAIDFVKKNEDYGVPLHLRNSPTKLMKDLGYGDDYKYSHNYAEGFENQEYLPKMISGINFISFSDNVKEEKLKNYMVKLWKNKYEF